MTIFEKTALELTRSLYRELVAPAKSSGPTFNPATFDLRHELEQRLRVRHGSFEPAQAGPALRTAELLWATLLSPIDFQSLKNTTVIITTVRGAKYRGLLSRVNDARIYLSQLVILTKNGDYKAISGNRNNNNRWFNRASVVLVEPDSSHQEPMA